MKKIELFTDGACRGNPGPGGWGALLRFNGNEKHFSGAMIDTTNNRMELTAVIMGLQQIRQSCEITITTDSRYVMDGITKWITGWKSRNWMTSQKKPVKNVDLWQQLEEALADHKVEWEWVNSHTGHPENEFVDGLAKRAIDRLLEE